MSSNATHPLSQSNGQRRPARLDRRSRAARRMRALRDEMLATIPNPSDAQRAVAERVAGLRVSAEQQEALMAAGDDRFDARLHARLCGAWLRLAKELSGPVVATSTPKTNTPMTLETLFGYGEEQPTHTSRFARYAGLVDDDDDDSTADFESEPAHTNGKAPPSRRQIKRRRIKGSKR